MSGKVPTRRPRVALDLTPLLGRPTGVGVFTRALAAELAVRPDLDPVGFAVTWRGRGELARIAPAGFRTAPAGFRIVSRPMPARPLRAMWSRAEWPPLEWFSGPVDLVHGTNFVVPPTRRAARLITVHDLTPVRFPQLCTPDTLAYPHLIRRAWRRGAWIHTDSSFVADEVRDWLQVSDADAGRVVPIHLGVTPSAAGDPEAGQTLARARRYVLALGTVEPRKGLVDLVNAFDALARGDDPGRPPADHIALVIAGPDGWGIDAFDAALAQCRWRNRVIRLGWVEDQQRADLLAGAQVLAYPSVYEGFGLPPLEAMAMGVPVVCSDAGSLPEVTGDGAVRVPVGDVEALAAALTEAVSDTPAANARRTQQIAAGQHRAARFDWGSCAQGLVDLYSRMLTIG